MQLLLCHRKLFMSFSSLALASVLLFNNEQELRLDMTSFSDEKEIFNSCMRPKINCGLPKVFER